jgi:signal transduction histidine kinase
MPVVHGTTVVGVGEYLLRDDREPDRGMLATLGAIGSQVGQYIVRRRAEAEADRLKNEFFALVSHELRTPLTSIVGYLDLALEDDDLAADTRQFLSVVERNSSRLLRLVGDLLFVAQAGSGETALDLRPVDLATIAADAVEAAAPRARDAGIELLLETEALPPVVGDPGRLAQALDNLVSNAIKFTPASGQVCVRLKGEDGRAIVEVSDTGIGMTPDDQARVFDRFYRSSAATERAIQGVGLGLTIVKTIIGGHGGQIEVESTEGAGTTFRASLPLRAIPT